MGRRLKWFSILLSFLLATNWGLYPAFADHDDHKEKRRYQKRERKHSGHNCKKNLTIVNNEAYKENCGACHLAYQPGLLPSGSWDKILAGLADHFGEAIELDTESRKVISEYLRSNAAEFSSTELSGKIMKSIGSQKPLRITEIPYIQKKHHEVKQSVLKQESVGSLSNCSACHTTAESGIYNDDNVKIPK